LKINSTSANNQGLFGWIGAGGEVKNLTITGVALSASAWVGGVAGGGSQQGSTVSSCVALNPSVTRTSGTGTTGRVAGNENRYIEIYNPTPAAVSLSGWRLRLYNAGETESGAVMEFTGSIPAAGCVVAQHYQADMWDGTAWGGTVISNSNPVTAMAYNGDDPVGLFNGNILVDIVGTPSATVFKFGENTTLVRKPGHGASVTYNANDWTAHSVDTVSNLGSHNF